MEEHGIVLDASSVNDPEEARPLEDPLGLLGRRDFSLLIVDDAPTIRQSVRDIVARLGVFTSCLEAENGLDALKKALTSRPDLILCDLVMPTVDGLKFLSLLYAKPEMRQIPVIILTGKADVETKIKGLELGASDYVTKPFDEGELLARIKVQLKIKALQDSLHTANQKLWELSTVDALTRLYNRRYFMHQIDKEFRRAARYGGPLSFVLFDIDHFKKVNDLHGHQVGDQVLEEVGRRLSATVRTSDVACRYGGEELCVLLPHTDLKGAQRFGERMLDALRATPVATTDGPLAIRMSAGAASSLQEGIDSPEVLIQRADEALYRAKGAGRDRVEVHDATESAPAAGEETP